MTLYDEKYRLFRMMLHFLEEKMQSYMDLTAEEIQKFCQSLKLPAGVLLDELMKFILNLARGDQYSWQRLRDITAETDEHKTVNKLHEELRKQRLISRKKTNE
jgi:hypothetical protein